MNVTKKKMLDRIFVTAIVFMLCVMLGVACERDVPGEKPDSPGPGQIWMENSTFRPKQKTIYVGTEITWINKDRVPHTIVSGRPGEATDAFKSDGIGAAGAFTHTFNDTGTFHYFCQLHPEMRGTIIVE